MLLQSEHRTLDPEEAGEAPCSAGPRSNVCNMRTAGAPHLLHPNADFFYVPVFTSCFMYPVHGGSASVRDWFYGTAELRVHGATNMLLEALYWIQSHHPWW